MGAWGITMRESDYGLDLLSAIVEEQLKPIQFAYFDAANAIALLRQYTAKRRRNTFAAWKRWAS